MTSDTDILLDLLTLSGLRGPDSMVARKVSPNCWMGFNRLAIQDLTDAGSQPISSMDGRFTLVFNGEVYNHLSIRLQLLPRPYKGHSDSETVVEAISQWGFKRTIEALDGMFALACYSHNEDVLYCARDFAGIKPFFYGWDGTTFVGASQYDQVCEHPKFNNQSLQDSVLRLYLEQHFIPAPFGLMKDTGQLEPGEIIVVQKGKMFRERYWEFPDWVEPSITDRVQAIELIDTVLHQSVKDQLIADVKVGAFLSGGVDSPLIAYDASREFPGLSTFTIGSDSQVHDESEDARFYSKLLDVKHAELKLNAASLSDTFAEVMACVREPMADFSVIPTWIVSRLAKSQVTVALSGDGGDELFYGYERFWSLSKNLPFMHFPWPFRAGVYLMDKWLTSSKNYNSVLLTDYLGKAHRGLHSRFPAQWLNRLFPHLSQVRTPDNYVVYDYSNTCNESELLQRMRKSEFYGMMQKTLRKVDLASMGNSLEVRVPFLSKQMIEASLKIDPFLSSKRGLKKEILKDLLRSRFPSAPVGSVKRGFSVPLGQWMRSPGFLEHVFENPRQILVQRYGMVPAAFEAMIHEHKIGAVDYKWPLFTLLALGNK